MVDVILTDDSNGMTEVAERLSQMKVFDNVYCVLTRDRYRGGGLRKKIRKCFYILEREEKFNSMFPIRTDQYSDMFFCNFDTISYEIYIRLKKKNRNLVCHRFEEGYSTYTCADLYDRRFGLFAKIACRLQGIESLHKATSILHLYEPDLLQYDCSYKIMKIRKLEQTDSKLRALWNSLFDLSGDIDNPYKDYKYIFFEESFFADGFKINDLPLILNIAKTVGKENMIIKLHPRTQEDRFKKHGIRSVRDKIPWEVLMMNGAGEGKELLSISSGAVIQAVAWFETAATGTLFFECLDRKPKLVDQKYKSYLDGLSRKQNVNFYVPAVFSEWEKTK